MKTHAAIALCACLFCAAPALAAPANFGPDFCRFSVEVPEGWTARAMNDGVHIYAPDEQTFVDIQIAKTEGTSAERMARAIFAELKNPAARLEKINESYFAISFLLADGTKSTITLAVDGERALVVTRAGKDASTMAKILSSIGTPK